MTSEQETCNRCGHEKSVSDFPARQGKGKVLRSRMCQSCRNLADLEKHRRWAEANPEKALERYREYDRRNNEARRARWFNDPDYKQRNLEAAKRWRDRNVDKIKITNRNRFIKIRNAVFDIYGAVCACCGEDSKEFLVVDHVNGGGNVQRKSGMDSYKLRKLLISYGVPHPAYRILCHNCNSSLGIYGYCPHSNINLLDLSSLDVVGFDSATPNLISEFARL